MSVLLCNCLHLHYSKKAVVEREREREKKNKRGPLKTSQVPAGPWILWQRIREARQTPAKLHCTAPVPVLSLQTKSSHQSHSLLLLFFFFFPSSVGAVSLFMCSRQWPVLTLLYVILQTVPPVLPYLNQALCLVSRCLFITPLQS